MAVPFEIGAVAFNCNECVSMTDVSCRQVWLTLGLSAAKASSSAVSGRVSKADMVGEGLVGDRGDDDDKGGQ